MTFQLFKTNIITVGDISFTNYTVVRAAGLLTISTKHNVFKDLKPVAGAITLPGKAADYVLVKTTRGDKVWCELAPADTDEFTEIIGM